MRILLIVGAVVAAIGLFAETPLRELPSIAAHARFLFDSLHTVP